MYDSFMHRSPAPARTRPGRRRTTAWALVTVLAVTALLAATGCASSTTDLASASSTAAPTTVPAGRGTVPSTTVAAEPPGTAVAVSASTFVGRVADSAASSAEIDTRQEAWRQAYLNTPHGAPVELANAACPPKNAGHHHHHDHDHDHDDDHHHEPPKPVAVSPARS